MGYLEYETVGHQLPQIFDLKIRHPVFFFYLVELAVATMAGNDKHFSAGSLDLIHFPAGVENTIFVIAGNQRTAAAAATDLVQTVWIKIHPVLQALIQNPARFVKKTVSEAFQGFAAVVAGIVIGGQDIEPGPVQSDAPFFDILNKQVKYRYKSEFFESFRIICFEPRPGC